MKQPLFIIAIVITASAAFGQTPWAKNRDSLLAVLARAKEDTSKVWTMVRLGQVYLNSEQQDSAVYYAKAFGALSAKLNFALGKSYSLSMQALVLGKHNKTDEAIAMDLQAIDIAKKAHLRKVLANLYNNLGLIYGSKKDIPESLDLYLKAETIYEELNDSFSLAFLYGNLAWIYIDLTEYKNAYLNSLKWILLCRSLHQSFGLAADMINLSSSLVNLQRFDTALIVLNETKELINRYHGHGSNTSVLGLISEAYLGLGKFSLLKTNAEELITYAKSIDDSDGICNGLSGLVSYYIHDKNYPIATKCAKEAIGIAKRNNLILNLRDEYKDASRIELEKGNLAGFDYYDELRDSIDKVIRSDKIIRNTQELEAKYSLNKKQAEIDELNQQKKIDQLTLRQRYILNLALVFIVLVSLVIVFLYYRNYRQKRKLLLTNTLLHQQRITELEKEKQLLAAQAVLQGQVEERTRLAKDLHDGLGSILSSAKYSFAHMKENLIVTSENAAAFEKSMGMLDHSISELRRVAHNMMPEALMKFGLDTALKDFCNNIDLSGAIQLTYQSFEIDEVSISKSTASAVYRIIQELVNNILKHASATKGLVQLIRKNDTLSITVEDNGKGFDTGILQNNQGMGYLNLQNRVTYLNGTIDIQTEAGKGTSVSIEISKISE
jgi:two-component system NarL family sensor kinase